MVQEKQEKRFLQIFNRNEETAAVEFTLSVTLLTALLPLQVISMNFTEDFQNRYFYELLCTTTLDVGKMFHKHCQKFNLAMQIQLKCYILRVSYNCNHN